MMSYEFDMVQLRLRSCIGRKHIKLHLRSSNIESLNDLPQLYECTHLTSLDLSNNNLSDLTALASLTELTELYLHENQINDLTPLTNLTKLIKLHLGINQINDLTPLANLTQLTELYLFENQISNIEPLIQLKNLKILNLEKNKIKTVPQQLINVPLNFDFSLDAKSSAIRLGYNPITTPPPEILKQGRQAFIDWYAAQKIDLNEIKVILIGDAKAGKTSLLKRLKNNNFDENEVQTDGVNIEDLTFSDCNTFKEQQDLHGLTGHFWDFGGQEIMNATHQFFLTRRSVYILLLDARKDGNVAGQIREWLKRVNATGGDSSIIVVANQIDVNPGFGFAGEFELQKEFPQIKAFIKASCKTEQGLDDIKNALNDWLPKAELFHTEIDTRWMEIKEKLQQITKEKHFLDEQSFINICNECDLTDKRQQANAINFLHDLGLVLHFEEVRLAEYYVLDPYWITYGVYQILTSKRAGEQLGHVSVNDLEYIINEEEDKTQSYQPSDYKKIDYSNAQRLFLFDILCKFKLCYEIEKSNPTTFILPDLLSTKEPLEHTQLIRDGENKINLVYKYSYLPKSILVNAMVDLHQQIDERWRTGFTMSTQDAQALVTVYDQQLSIQITGEGQQKRELMAVIRYAIDSANKVLTEQPDLLIPLPDCNKFVRYKTLVKMEQMGREEYEIFEPDYFSFNISDLLAGIRVESQENIAINLLTQLLPKLDDIQQTQSEELALVFNAVDEQLAALAESFSEQQQTLYEQAQNAATPQVKFKMALPLYIASLEGEVDLKDNYNQAKINQTLLKLANMVRPIIG